MWKSLNPVLKFYPLFIRMARWSKKWKLFIHAKSAAKQKVTRRQIKSAGERKDNVNAQWSGAAQGLSFMHLARHQPDFTRRHLIHYSFPRQYARATLPHVERKHCVIGYACHDATIILLAGCSGLPKQTHRDLIRGLSGVHLATR